MHSQLTHSDTHPTCQQPTLTAPSDLSASSPHGTATSQQTISTVTTKPFILPFLLCLFPQTCSAAISTKLHFRHNLGYRAVALLASVTNPASGVEIKPEPIFIMFSKEKATFSALQNNVRVCTVFLICNSKVQAAFLDGLSTQSAFLLPWAQHWEADPASCSSRATKCTTSKGKSCLPHTSAACAWNPPVQGEAPTQGKPWTLIITLQVIPYQPPAAA